MISVPLILLGHWRGNGLAILCDPGIPLAPKALGVEVEATPSSWKHSTRKFCCEAYMAHIGLQFESESSRIESSRWRQDVQVRPLATPPFLAEGEAGGIAKSWCL